VGDLSIEEAEGMHASADAAYVGVAAAAVAVAFAAAVAVAAVAVAVAAAAAAAVVAGEMKEEACFVLQACHDRSKSRLDVESDSRLEWEPHRGSTAVVVADSIGYPMFSAGVRYTEEQCSADATRMEKELG
jgi:hypothetical protein